MALTTASTAREIIAAIEAASAVLPVCTVYPRAPSVGSFFRFQPVPANALGWIGVDLTPRANDPNGKPFVPVFETFSVALSNQKFSAASTALCVTAAVAALEAGVAAALVSEVAGPRIRVLIGATTAITKPNINFTLSMDSQIIAASDAGPLGRFA